MSCHVIAFEHVHNAKFSLPFRLNFQLLRDILAKQWNVCHSVCRWDLNTASKLVRFK